MMSTEQIRKIDYDPRQANSIADRIFGWHVLDSLLTVRDKKDTACVAVRGLIDLTPEGAEVFGKLIAKFPEMDEDPTTRFLRDRDGRLWGLGYRKRDAEGNETNRWQLWDNTTSMLNRMRTVLHIEVKQAINLQPGGRMGIYLGEGTVIRLQVWKEK